MGGGETFKTILSSRSHLCRGKTAQGIHARESQESVEHRDNAPERVGAPFRLRRWFGQPPSSTRKRDRERRERPQQLDTDAVVAVITHRCESGMRPVSYSRLPIKCVVTLSPWSVGQPPSSTRQRHRQQRKAAIAAVR